MKITLLTVGKTDVRWVREGLDLYVSRLKHYVPFVLNEIPELKNVSALSQDQIKEREGDLVLAALKPGDEKTVRLELSRIYAGFVRIEARTEGELLARVSCREQEEKGSEEQALFAVRNGLIVDGEDQRPRRKIPFRKHLQDTFAGAARLYAVLNGNHEFRARRVDDGLLIEGLHPAHVDHARLDTVFRELFRRLDGRDNAVAERQDGHIVAFAHDA